MFVRRSADWECQHVQGSPSTRSSTPGVRLHWQGSVVLLEFLHRPDVLCAREQANLMAAIQNRHFFCDVQGVRTENLKMKGVQSSAVLALGYPCHS